LFKDGLETKERLTFQEAANEVFLKASVVETLARYQAAWEWMGNSESPYISIADKPETGETRVWLESMAREHGISWPSLQTRCAEARF